MTPADVRNYRFLDRMIAVAERQVDKVREQMTVRDSVLGSNPEYPYEQKSLSVVGTGRRLEYRAAVAEVERLKGLKAEIEEVLEAVKDDHLTRDLFWGTMLGKSQAEIATTLGISQQTVSRKLTQLCKLFQIDEKI